MKTLTWTESEVVRVEKKCSCKHPLEANVRRWVNFVKCVYLLKDLTSEDECKDYEQRSCISWPWDENRAKGYWNNYKSRRVSYDDGNRRCFPDDRDRFHLVARL
jgi:hypothetical protein